MGIILAPFVQYVWARDGNPYLDVFHTMCFTLYLVPHALPSHGIEMRGVFILMQVHTCCIDAASVYSTRLAI